MNWIIWKCGQHKVPLQDTVCYWKNNRTENTHTHNVEVSALWLQVTKKKKKGWYDTYFPGSSKYIETGRSVDSANSNKPWRKKIKKKTLGENQQLVKKNQHLQGWKEIKPVCPWIVLISLRNRNNYYIIVTVCHTCHYTHTHTPLCSLTRHSFRQKVMLLWDWAAKWSNSSEARHSSVSMDLDCSGIKTDGKRKKMKIQSEVNVLFHC